jgi:hypothetical protein
MKRLLKPRSYKRVGFFVATEAIMKNVEQLVDRVRNGEYRIRPDDVLAADIIMLTEQ